MAKYLGISALLLLASGAQPATASVTPGEIDVLAQTGASTDQDPGQYDYQEIPSGFSNFPIDVPDGSTAANYSAAPPYTAVVTASDFSQTTALFADPADGMVTFTGTAMVKITAAGYDADPAAMASAYGLNDFEYSFSTDTSAVLTVTYSLSDDGIGSDAGIGSEDPGIFSFTGPPLYMNQMVNLPINGSGSATLDFAPGSYTLGFFSGDPAENIAQTGAVGEASASLDDQFRFAITPAVPEPATWLMMLAGFGAIGLSTRGRVRRNLRAA